MRHQELRSIPSVNRLLAVPQVHVLMEMHGRPLILTLLRQTLDHIRRDIADGIPAPSFEETVERLIASINALTEGGLRRVINATGVLLHTNLGRAPFGRELLLENLPILEGYSNLEFRLESGERGHRREHLAPLLRLATGAEDALVVNNNAAGVMLALHTFAKAKEVISSRGELIEIGGSFRMPDIIEASGAHLVEVGATNRTRISDYERAISERTSVILKSHCSNYAITGFTEQTSIRDLASLSRNRGLILLHDIGSGLVGAAVSPLLSGEPDARSSIADGADLVTFSCDKLLGGPQAGIIAGRSELIAAMASQPLMRALRVEKITIALLRTILLRHLGGNEDVAPSALAALLQRTTLQRASMAKQLAGMLRERNIACTVVPSNGCFGGGSLPGQHIESHAVRIEISTARSADALILALLRASTPVVSVPREGKIYLDVLAMFDEDIPIVATAVEETLCGI